MFAIVLNWWGLVWRNRAHFLLCCRHDYGNMIWWQIRAPDCVLDWLTDCPTEKNCTRFVTLYTSDSTLLSDCDLSICVAVIESCYPSSKQFNWSCLDWNNFVCPHPKCSFEISSIIWIIFFCVCLCISYFVSLLGILWHYIANNTALCVATPVP